MIHSIDPAACTGCGTCTKTCPLDVFRLEPAQEALSPCMAACPAGVDIRGNHYLIQQGHLGEAARPSRAGYVSIPARKNAPGTMWTRR